MNKRNRMYNKILLCFLICVANQSYAQLGHITTSNYIDRSNMIIVGKVEKRVQLYSTQDSIIRLSSDSVVKIYTISVSRSMKGVSNVDTLDVITYGGDNCGGSHLRTIRPFLHKRHLFFLDTAHVPSNLITKYNLQGRTFFTTYLCGLGIFELNHQWGIDMLREIEDSLNIAPPTPITIIPLTGWIDSLSAATSQALSNRLIGDSAFVDTLHGVLNHAHDLVQQGDSTDCAHELLRFDHMIEGAFWGFDRIRFINSELWSSLSSDVLYILTDLPDIPYGYSSLATVDSLTPKSTRAGEQGFTLTINGERFENGATVYWNWSPRATTFISSTQLQATITSQDIASPETATVAVVNPAGQTHGEWLIVRKSYTLTVSATNGSVTKNPNQTTYDSASTVQLTPVPNTGYLFTKWSGNIQPSDSFSNPLSVTMNSNKTITATFVLSTDTIVATAGTHGSISPSGVVVVNYGSNKTVTITPNSCYHIDSVIVDGVKKDSTTSYTFINVTANHTIRSVYKINRDTITVVPSSQGTINPSGNVILDCGGSQTFTITPNAGWEITDVLVDGQSVGIVGEYTFENVTTHRTIEARYEIAPPPCTCCDLPVELDQMMLTDANGKRNVLFLRNAQLPHAGGVSDSVVVARTKKGTLNAAFTSGQLVQTVIPDQPIQNVSITVHSASYPITLNWNVKTKNKTKYWYIDASGKKTALTNKGSIKITSTSGGTIQLQASADRPCP